MTTPSDFEGVPLSRLLDTRDNLTALIEQNLYGRGQKSEGRAALIVRNRLDEFLFNISPDTILKGEHTDLLPLKRGIVLQGYAELIAILDDYSSRFGSNGNAIRKGMSALSSDPDVLGRFTAEQQARIQAIGRGYSYFAKKRFDQLHLSIRREAGSYMDRP